MINAKQAAELVKSRYPKVNPVLVIDYSNEYYVVEASELEGSMDLSDPFYKVSKDGKECVFYSPLEDLDKFIEASKKSIRLK